MTLPSEPTAQLRIVVDDVTGEETLQQLWKIEHNSGCHTGEWRDVRRVSPDRVKLSAEVKRRP